MSNNVLICRNYDISATSYTYPRLSELINSRKYLTTSGSSTTVSELNASDDTFAGFGVGDLIDVEVDGAHTLRTVTNAGGVPDSVTVDTAVDWSNGGAGRAFSFRRFSNGTAITDGWFSVVDYSKRAVQIVVTTINATSLDFTIEGRIRLSGATTVLWSKSYTAANTTPSTTGGPDIINVSEGVDDLRVGMKVSTDGGAQSVTVVFRGEPVRATGIL